MSDLDWSPLHPLGQIPTESTFDAYHAAVKAGPEAIDVCVVSMPSLAVLRHG